MPAPFKRLIRRIPASFAIKATDGHDSATVNNAGTVSGNVDLGPGADAFNNMAGATFNSGTLTKLDGGNLNNAGTLSPGGAGAITATSLNGNLVQTATASTPPTSTSRAGPPI